MQIIVYLLANDIETKGCILWLNIQSQTIFNPIVAIFSWNWNVWGPPELLWKLNTKKPKTDKKFNLWTS